MENKEQIKQAARDNWDSINGQFKDGLNPYAHMIGFIAGASWQSSQPINSGWVSVEDRLPNPEQEVIIYFNDYGHDIIRYDVFEEDFATYSTHVTHWMPLPEAPPKQ
jgi:hypothetical protein